LRDVTGQRIFEAGTFEDVEDDIRTLSEGTLDRLEE
jgi:hypothetical protein